MGTKTINTRISMKHDTTANWNKAVNFIGLPGEIIIYDDRYSFQIEEGGETKTVYVPGIKICDGLAYLVDLPFIDYITNSTLSQHINNTAIHVSAADRTFWNNKMNADEDLDGETLILTKDQR